MADGCGETIPTYDGKTPFRIYERKVQIFEANTKLPKERRGGRLLERLEGEAFDATETLDVASLSVPDGVALLMAHLRKKFEPIEVLRIGRIVDDFLYEFERRNGEEMQEYDMRFTNLLARFEGVAGKVNPVIKAHVFLKRARLPAQVESQVVSAALNKYEYEPCGTPCSRRSRE